MTRTSAAAVAILVALAATWGLWPAAPYPLPVGDPWAIEVRGGEAAFDLPLAGPQEQYLLVISSLALDGAPHDVEIHSLPVDRARAGTWHPLPQLPAAPRRAIVPAPLSAVPGLASLERTFQLHVTHGAADNPAAYQRIAARLAAEGRRCRVYVDRQDRIDPVTAEFIVGTVDAQVFPLLTPLLGAPLDVDGDGKLAIVLTGWLDRLRDGEVSLGGMVSADDFFGHRGTPFSNRADVLYLNANVRPGAHLATLLAHEWTHAITASGKVQATLGETPLTPEESWLNEGVSHLAENLLGDNWSNLDYRVACALSSPHTAPLVLPPGPAAELWRAPAPRGSSYLFLRWCVEQYGTDFLPLLIHSPRRGLANLEAAAGQPWPELFRRFAADLFLACLHNSPATAGQKGGALPPLNLGEGVGGWPLAGPYFEDWQLDVRHEPASLPLAGTSTRYVRLWSAAAGPRRVTIRAAPEAALQVSLVRLPEDLPRLRLHARLDGLGRICAELTEENGQPIELTHVAWGPLSEFGPVQRRLHEQRRAAELPTLLGDGRLSAHGSLASGPLFAGHIPAGLYYIQAAGLDHVGRRVTAWTAFDSREASPRLALRP